LPEIWTAPESLSTLCARAKIVRTLSPQLSTKPVENSVEKAHFASRRASDSRHLTYLPKIQATQEILEIPRKNESQSRRMAGMS
jgi:hypothetical protein